MPALLVLSSCGQTQSSESIPSIPSASITQGTSQSSSGKIYYEKSGTKCYSYAAVKFQNGYLTYLHYSAGGTATHDIETVFNTKIDIPEPYYLG